MMGIACPGPGKKGGSGAGNWLNRVTRRAGRKAVLEEGRRQKNCGAEKRVQGTSVQWGHGWTGRRRAQALGWRGLN